MKRMPGTAVLVSIVSLAGCSSTAQGTGTSDGRDGLSSRRSGASGCAADDPLSCKGTLSCEAVCAGDDEGCFAACEKRTAAASKALFDAANGCVASSGCETADCAIERCRKPLEACVADEAPCETAEPAASGR